MFIYGFHTSAGSTAPDKAIYPLLRERGLPVVMKCTDGATGIYDALVDANDKDVIVFRASTFGQNDGYDYDVLPDIQAHLIVTGKQ